MKTILYLTFMLCLFVGVSAADRHIQTSIHPINGMLQIELPDNTITVNTNTPGVIIKKYPNGALKQITLNQVRTLYQIDYYEPADLDSEQVSRVLKLDNINGLYYLHGKSYTLSRTGKFLTVSNWSEGQLDGKQEIYDEFQQIREERVFSKGFPVGEWNYYYANGYKSRQLTLPNNKEEWEQLKRPLAKAQRGPIPEHEETYNVQELWFDEEGRKEKELYYMAQQKGDKFILQENGKSISFDQYGRTLAETEFIGDKGRHTQYFYTDNTVQSKTEYIIRDKVFKQISLNTPEILIPVLAP
ncbi:MAG: hypothetical protein CMO81_05090 [Waddliaceae bacterium]|nr:hypothetical protein [Waddliaceae bacterium]